MADSVREPPPEAAVTATITTAHSPLVRITHWITAACFLALLVTGAEILSSHPRFYWGETGNVRMSPLFTIPIPASRTSVTTGYGYALTDQNGWSRSLHFQSAWLVVLTGLLYVSRGLANGHFRRNLLPHQGDLSRRALSAEIRDHIRLRPGGLQADAWSYNTLQRLAYLLVIFVLFPLVIWTGLAMSPAVTAAFPATVTLLGGQQSARTIHFFVSTLLACFLVAHIAMIYLAGFRDRMQAMIKGSAPGTDIAGRSRDRI